MTGQQPTFFSQGVNYLGFLSQQLGDLRGKTTLAHELIQNADDAKDDSGMLSATQVTFDVKDDALIVSNDAIFRESDFRRMRDVASGSKRSESGERTTGAFGVGFISVYQITDTPEIHSAGRTWILRPDSREDTRIEQRLDPSITPDKGTMFRLPWAFEESIVRKELKAPTVDAEYINSFVDELKESLTRAILFLKKLESIELRRNGQLVSEVTRKVSDNAIEVSQDGDVRSWRVLENYFSEEALLLKTSFGDNIEKGRSDRVRLAVANSPIHDGLLFATLPTEQYTGLPFHIDADFYPASDRKAIEFGDAHDPRSEWNRAAIRAAATAVQTNLISLRYVFGDDAPTAAWDFLSKIYEVHRDKGSDTRLPLGEFWKSLLPSLREVPIVYTGSSRWLAPPLTRIPSGSKEGEAVRAFQALGVEIVHPGLWGSPRNLLTRRDVGVRRISAEDIYSRLAAIGYANGPISSRPVEADLLELLWRGIEGVLENEQGNSRETAEYLLGDCALAPGLDGRLWPCRTALRTDERTRELFEPLLPEDATFLALEGTPLLEQLCPEFTVSEAIKVLRSHDPGELQDSRDSGAYDPVAVLQWFNDRRLDLDPDLLEQLTNLPVFPSAKALLPLNSLWLPGGFEDPLGDTDLLDPAASVSLAGFLQDLGIRKLTFRDYAIRNIPRAFARDSEVDMRTRRKLVDILQRNIGEIKDDSQVSRALDAAWIVECEDGTFRQPGTVYFPSEEVKALLGNNASYARLPDPSDLRRDLYKWLGVQSLARITDLLRLVERTTATRPTQNARTTVIRVLEALGLRWSTLDESNRLLCRYLKTKSWLPVQADAKVWYRPDEVFAVYNRNLFASQARFLDAPVRVQQTIAGLLTELGVNTRPRAFQVVRHLLRCSELDADPPGGIYQWLNDNAKAGELRELRNSACLRVEGSYLRPDQVFWGSHPFGNYRVQLGSELRSFQDLLESLGVREKPDFNGAFDVLQDVSEHTGNGILDHDDSIAVMQCWVMLSDALEWGDLDSESIATKLGDTQCVPTDQGVLKRPSWMFFEDRAGIADRFAVLLEQNCIRRTERAWPAMEAAGVRPVSEVVLGYVDECVNPHEDQRMSDWVADRAGLINTILEGATGSSTLIGGGSVLDGVRFVRGDELTVKWTLKAFGERWPDTPPERASAHWDSQEQLMYFVKGSNGLPPWSAIARELALALAPGENPTSISPGLKSVLEAETSHEAKSQLGELGIVSIHVLEAGAAGGTIVNSLGDGTSQVDAGHMVPNIPSTNHTPGDTGRPGDPFARLFHEEQTITPSHAPDNPAVLPVGGPNTTQSAQDYTVRSGRAGRTEAHQIRQVARTELGPQGRELAEEFRDMVHGDYGKRCQVCSRTFVRTGGGWQVNVVHVVPPRTDHRTNHFGDLLGLCGWHFALMWSGEWAIIDSGSGQPFDDLDGLRGWERMRSFILSRPPTVDTEGVSYVGLPVRFSNVYQDWKSESTTIKEEIRYSIPHWKFLRELLNV